MIDRAPIAPVGAPTARLHAWYGSAAALLRELSRALNQEQTLLRADSGMPVGTHLVLALSTDCLSAPIEVQGTVTSWRVSGDRHEMTLRYDFDAVKQRRHLDEALAGVREQARRPRRVTRVPLTVATDAVALARGLEVTVVDASRTGARLRVSGTTLPVITPGARLVMRHQGRRPGMRRPLRLVLEVRWAGPRRRACERSTQTVGGRFLELSDSLRKRLRSLLSFEDARPQLSLLSLAAPKRTAARRRVLKR